MKKLTSFALAFVLMLGVLAAISGCDVLSAIDNSDPVVPAVSDPVVSDSGDSGVVRSDDPFRPEMSKDIEAAEKTRGSEKGWDSYLDTTSANAFISGMKEIYDITLIDENGYLSGRDGEWSMTSLDYGLGVFSPEFIKKLVAVYASYNARFVIKLVPAEVQGHAGMTEWVENSEITIYLRYVEGDYYYNGVCASTLAHELGHAVQFIADKQIGEQKILDDMTLINNGFPYVGDNWDEEWKLEKYTAFANAYSTKNYKEDIATTIEMLVGTPTAAQMLFSEPANKIIREKTEYIRGLFYQTVSNDCAKVFSPLDQAK